MGLAPSCISFGTCAGLVLFRVGAYSGSPFKDVNSFRVRVIWCVVEAPCVRAAVVVIPSFRIAEFSPCQRYSSDRGRVRGLVRGGVRRLVRETPRFSHWG